MFCKNWLWKPCLCIHFMSVLKNGVTRAWSLSLEQQRACWSRWNGEMWRKLDIRPAAPISLYESVVYKPPTNHFSPLYSKIKVWDWSSLELSWLLYSRPLSLCLHMVRPRFTTTSADIEAVEQVTSRQNWSKQPINYQGGWDWGFAMAIHKVTWDNGTAGKGVFWTVI